MPPLTGYAIGDQVISPQAQVASASNFVSASKAPSEDNTNRVFLQVSSSNFFSDLSIPGDSRTEKVSHAPARDEFTFTSQPQWDDVTTSAPVGTSDIMSYVQSSSVTGGLLRYSYAGFSRDWSLLDHFYINHNTEAPVNLPVATAISGDAGRAGTVLGKRVRERYEIYRRNAPQSLMIAAAALDHPPERGKGQATVGSRRQRELFQGFTEHLLPRPNKRTKYTSMTA